MNGGVRNTLDQRHFLTHLTSVVELLVRRCEKFATSDVSDAKGIRVKHPTSLLGGIIDCLMMELAAHKFSNMLVISDELQEANRVSPDPKVCW